MPTDTQKTPRTDARELACGWDTTHPVVHSSFARELEQELAEKDRQLTVALKGKRPFSSAFAEQIMEGQKKRIEELETALNGWFAERNELLGILSGIISDLPVRRDWLNPDLEKIARAAIAKISP